MDTHQQDLEITGKTKARSPIFWMVKWTTFRMKRTAGIAGYKQYAWNGRYNLTISLHLAERCQSGSPHRWWIGCGRRSCDSNNHSTSLLISLRQRDAWQKGAQGWQIWVVHLQITSWTEMSLCTKWRAIIFCQAIHKNCFTLSQYFLTFNFMEHKFNFVCHIQQVNKFVHLKTS